MAAPVVWHPDYMTQLRPGHAFPMSKYGYLRTALEARGLMDGWLAPAPLTAPRLAAAHDWGYVERVLAGTLRPDEVRRIGLPASEAVARRARLASAGTLLAARLALERGLAVNMAGGSHHAGPGHGAGFCVFNDVAVAARALLDEGLAARLLVVDCDVHQGDGTALIFEGDARVFTLSIHAARNFPVRKARSDLDLGLEDGTGDADYLARLGEALDEALARAAPDLAFYNAGVDVWEGDRLGRLGLTLAGIRRRDRLVLGRLRAAGVPVAAALGGGYSHDPEELAARHAILFEEAAALA